MLVKEISTEAMARIITKEEQETLKKAISITERVIGEQLELLQSYREALQKLSEEETEIWTPKVMDGFERAFYRITKQQKWLRFAKPNFFLTKDNWEAYRLQITVWFCEICKHNGEKIDENGLIAYQIYKIFYKAYIGDITRDDRERLRKKGFERAEEAFKEYVREVIKKTTSKGFLDFLEANITKDPVTLAVYKLAGEYGTEKEFNEITRGNGWVSSYTEQDRKIKLAEIQYNVKKGFERFPYIEKVMKDERQTQIWLEVSDGRFILRWQNCEYKLSDLGHMLLSADLEWLMEKEKGNADKAKIIWKRLLFHDSLEIKTGDPTSIVKDNVKNGVETLRSGIDRVGDEVAESVVERFPEWAQEMVRDILKETPDIKPADRLSLVIEAVFAFRAGSRDKEYLEPFERAQKHSFTPNIDFWIREKYLQAKETKFI